MVRPSHRHKLRPESETDPEIVDAPSLSPIRPPRWVPAGVEFDRLPRPVQQALVEIVEPLYEQLQVLLQVRNWLRRNREAREAEPWMPIDVTSRPAPSLPNEGQSLESMKSVAQNVAAVEQDEDQSAAGHVLENVKSVAQKACEEKGE
jgi:hypothetical protein